MNTNLRILNFQSRNFSETIKKVRDLERVGSIPKSIKNEGDGFLDAKSSRELERNGTPVAF